MVWVLVLVMISGFVVPSKDVVGLLVLLVVPLEDVVGVPVLVVISRVVVPSEVVVGLPVLECVDCVELDVGAAEDDDVISLVVDVGAAEDDDVISLVVDVGAAEDDDVVDVGAAEDDDVISLVVLSGSIGPGVEPGVLSVPMEAGVESGVLSRDAVVVSGPVGPVVASHSSSMVAAPDVTLLKQYSLLSGAPSLQYQCQQGPKCITEKYSYLV